MYVIHTYIHIHTYTVNIMAAPGPIPVAGIGYANPGSGTDSREPWYRYSTGTGSKPLHSGTGPDLKFQL